MHLPGLDAHGYPREPVGHAFPSAHTAVVVGLVLAMWPWTDRPRRVVGAAVAVLLAVHRIYIGAHWPLDVAGGAAIGVLAAAVAWLLAGSRPIAATS